MTDEFDDLTTNEREYMFMILGDAVRPLWSKESERVEGFYGVTANVKFDPEKCRGRDVVNPEILDRLKTRRILRSWGTKTDLVDPTNFVTLGTLTLRMAPRGYELWKTLQAMKVL